MKTFSLGFPQITVSHIVSLVWKYMNNFVSIPVLLNYFVRFLIQYANDSPISFFFSFFVHFIWEADRHSLHPLLTPQIPTLSGAGSGQSLEFCQGLPHGWQELNCYPLSLHCRTRHQGQSWAWNQGSPMWDQASQMLGSALLLQVPMVLLRS